MSVSEVKLNRKRNGLLSKPLATSNPFRSEAETDYNRKKEAERKAIHDEISRVSQKQMYI